MDAKNNRLLETYSILSNHYGHQPWWPAEDAFEVMVGAILTQNTAWTNVEKAIQNLKQKGLCNSRAIAGINKSELATVIRSSGYYNQKSERLIVFSQWYERQGGSKNLVAKDQLDLRQELLALNGIGEETADDILLYALNKPIFVIDSYTRRIFSRLGLLNDKSRYHDLQQFFHHALKPEVKLYQQYHALIVMHAKQHCTKKPSCEGCPLKQKCLYDEKI